VSSALAERRRCKNFTLRNRPRDRKRPDDFWRPCGDECHVYEKNFNVPFSAILEKALRGCRSIAMDPDVLGGTPRIAGTRIPVYMVLDAVEYYGTVEGALKSYPDLTEDQVKDALCFSGAVLEHAVDNESEASAG